MKKDKHSFLQQIRKLGAPLYMLGIAVKISKIYVLITALLAACDSIQPIITIWFTQRLIAGLMNGFTVESLVKTALLLVACSFCINFMKNFLKNRQQILAETVKDDFKGLVGKKIMSIQYAHLENPEIINLKERALRPIIEYGVLDRMLTEIIPSVLRGVFVLTETTAIVAVSFPVLLFPLLLVTVVNMLLLNRTKKIKNKTFDVVMPVERKIGYYTSLTFDYSIGKDVRLYSMEHLIMDKIRRLNRKDLKAVSSQFGRISRCAGLSALLSQGQMFITYGFLGYQALFHALSIADFTFYTGIFLNFGNALFSVITQISEVAYMGKFFLAYQEFACLPEKETKRSAQVDTDAPSVEFQDVSFTYPGAVGKTLDCVSFSICPKERIALVGTNGAGKSTLIKLLCGLYEPDSGEIRIGGKKAETREWTLSPVFQDYKLFAFTIYDNVVMGKGTNADISGVLKLAGIYDTVSALSDKEQTCLYRLFEDNGIELSGGQGQRLAIARALYKDSPVVILDEPTAALDPVAEQEIYDKFREICAGKTALLISHRLSSTRMCDRILVVDSGRIVETGTHEELMKLKCGVYRNMYEAQAKYYR